MNRRKFLSTSGSLGLAPLLTTHGAEAPAEKATPAPAPAPEAQPFTAGSPPGPVFAGSAVVTGPASDAITILQPLQRHATGFLEYAVGEGPFARVDASVAGLLPFEQHVLKFRLPSLPPGKEVRYRITARSIGWIQ